ncbi:hypothetical protein V8E36_002156 [Tilletia maclaganii]
MDQLKPTMTCKIEITLCLDGFLSSSYSSAASRDLESNPVIEENILLTRQSHGGRSFDPARDQRCAAALAAVAATASPDVAAATTIAVGQNALSVQYLSGTVRIDSHGDANKDIGDAAKALVDLLKQQIVSLELEVAKLKTKQDEVKISLMASDQETLRGELAAVTEQLSQHKAQKHKYASQLVGANNDARQAEARLTTIRKALNTEVKASAFILISPSRPLPLLA